VRRLTVVMTFMGILLGLGVEGEQRQARYRA
jgi:hypothetical protein